MDVVKKYYKNVPADVLRRYEQFRAAHTRRSLDVDGARWEYTVAGSGSSTLMVLPGGTGIGESLFLLTDAVEPDVRVVCVVYPPVRSVAQVVRGVLAIMDAEGIERAHFLGQIFGGIVTQVLIHQHPQRVQNALLSHTTTSSPPVDEALKRERVLSIQRFRGVLVKTPFFIMRWLFRNQLKRQIQMFDVPDREFWTAFYNETMGRTTQQMLLANYDCMMDFLENYRFEGADRAAWDGKMIILESDADTAIPEGEREALKALYPDARVKTFTGTGDMLTALFRDEYLALLRDLLAL